LASSRKGLTAIQEQVLEAFRGVQGAWLTGGAALSGFYLGHRISHDLDFFLVRRDQLPGLAARLVAWSETHGAHHVVLQRYPGFERHRVTLRGASTLVDLVHEPAHQVVPLASKPLVDGIRIDPKEEIRANKLAAILGRAETKDLLDLYALAESGLAPLAGLVDASRKDGGLDPATLAWVLSTLQVDLEGLKLLVNFDVLALEAFRDDLIHSLQREAWPNPIR
jgi:hypothetical protein